jgi:hypothetical protein
MPRLFIDEVDDEPVYDGSQNFAGGMVSLVKPQSLEANQCAELINCDIDRSGRIQTRRGTAALGDLSGDPNRVRGLTYYTGTNNYLVRVANGAMKKWDASNWTSIATFTSAVGTEVDMAQLGSVLYASNGTTLYQWSGSGAASAIASSPACTYLIAHSGRLFAAKINSADDIQCSSFLDGTVWTGDISIPIKIANDGDPITGWSPWHNNLLAVLKRNSIWVVDTDPNIAFSSKWTKSLVNSRIGCVAYRSVQQVGNDIFFLGDDGVRSIQRTINDNQIGVTVPLSDPIRPIIDRINWANADQSCACYINNRYLLAVPLDSATTPNYVIVYNTLTSCWSGYWTGWNPTVFALSKFSGTLKVTFGEVSGRVLEWLEWKAESNATATDYTDAATAIATSITTKAFSFADPISDKSGNSYELEFLRSVADASIALVADENSEQTSYSGRTRIPAITLPVTLPFTLSPLGSYRVARDLGTLGSFRTLQYKVESTGGKLAAQGVTMSGFTDSLQAEVN